MSDLGLEHYNEGLKPLKCFVDYELTICDLTFELRTQATLLRNALTDLLCSLVDESQIGPLLDDPGSSTWREENLARRLRERLQNSYEICLETAKRLYSTLEEFTSKVGLDPQGQVGVPSSHAGYGSATDQEVVAQVDRCKIAQALLEEVQDLSRSEGT